MRFIIQKRSVAVLMVTVMLGLGLGSVAHAQDGPLGVSITPLKWDMTGSPGDVFEQTVTAINPNNFPLTVVPEFQDFRVLDGAGIQWIPADAENPYRMTDWMSISTEPITLAAGKQTQVPFTITVPDNATVGGHYMAVFFRAVVDTKGATIGSIPRVGALIIFNVPGDVEKSGDISIFSVPKYFERGPVHFDLEVVNTGTTHYKPEVNVNIDNIVGRSVEIESERDRFIYPGVDRELKTIWDKKFPIGYFTATAVFVDGDGVTHSQKVWFIGFPWKHAVGLLFVIVIFYSMIVYARRHLKFVSDTSATPPTAEAPAEPAEEPVAQAPAEEEVTDTSVQPPDDGTS